MLTGRMVWTSVSRKSRRIDWRHGDDRRFPVPMMRHRRSTLNIETVPTPAADRRRSDGPTVGLDLSTQQVTAALDAAVADVFEARQGRSVFRSSGPAPCLSAETEGNLETLKLEGSVQRRDPATVASVNAEADELLRDGVQPEMAPIRVRRCGDPAFRCRRGGRKIASRFIPRAI